MRALGGIVKWTAIAGFLLAVQLAWSLGSLVEAYAVVRIDGTQAIPLFPLETCYPSGFTNASYLGVARGDTQDAVRARLGEPLAIHWALADDFLAPSLSFELAGGRWVSGYAYKVAVAKGTPMAALGGMRAGVVEEVWSYSRSCIPDDSKRVRWVSFRDGRVARRGSGIYYD